MLNYETCGLGSANPARDIESAWPILRDTMERHLRQVDAAAAYAAKMARDMGEDHNAALADAWGNAETRAYRKAFKGWREYPETLLIVVH